VRGTYLDKN
jgi:ribosome biogenesis protein BMS1